MAFWICESGILQNPSNPPRPRSRSSPASCIHAETPNLLGCPAGEGGGAPALEARFRGEPLAVARREADKPAGAAGRHRAAPPDPQARQGTTARRRRTGCRRAPPRATGAPIWLFLAAKPARASVSFFASGGCILACLRGCRTSTSLCPARQRPARNPLCDFAPAAPSIPLCPAHALLYLHAGATAHPPGYGVRVKP